MIIYLNAEELAELHKTSPDDKGKGGFQSYMVELQYRVDDDTGKLEISDEDFAKIKRYASYTSGGYQTRLKKIFARSFGDEFLWE